MRRVGIIIAGPYDSEVMPVLAAKCRNGIKVTTRQCGGSVLGKVLGIIRELEQRRKVDGIIVVEDAEGRPLNDLQGQIKQRLKKLGKGGPNPLRIEVVIAVQMMEAWLLADPKALASVLGNSVQAFPHPESIHNPKAELGRMLSANRIDYTRKVARSIAEAADIKQIAGRCPSFDRFRKLVAAI